jgi:hypothetical protein
MSDYAKIALIVATPFLIFGGLLFFTRGNPRRRFYIVWPVILGVSCWLGFSHGWETRDFVQLGLMLFWCLASGIMTFRKTALK